MSLDDKELKKILNTIREILSLPEFKFWKGDFFERIEHILYYNLGDFVLPVKPLLYDILEKLLEEIIELSKLPSKIKFNIDINFSYNINTEAAIMSQDINRVIGPIDELNFKELEKESFEDIIKKLSNFKPNKIGDIIISKPHWCKAKYLIEAVIYRFDKEEVTNEEIVRKVLIKCFKELYTLKIKSLSLDPLGTEYNVLSSETFIDILYDTLKIINHKLVYLEEIIICARTKEQAFILKSAFEKKFKIKIA